MKRPNFFIVGAPKCGTTALCEYLRQHPQIFISDPKEPHFFAEDMPRLRYVKSLQQYLSLFSKAIDVHRAVGEGSVGYLYSKVALQGIAEFTPDARIIVMVRNPIDMVYSMHNQFVYARWEDEPDFERAWGLQEERMKGKGIPSGCRVPSLLQYRSAGMLGSHITKLFGIFPKENVYIGVFDDLVQDPRGLYQSIIRFLGLDDDSRESFPKINESKIYRSGVAAWAFNWLKPIILPPVLLLRSKSGLDLLPLLRRTEVANVKQHSRPLMNEDTRVRLANEFRGDIEILSNLLDRDLMYWVENDHVKASI